MVVKSFYNEWEVEYDKIMQKAPKRMPKMMGTDQRSDEAASNVLEGAWQLWHVNGTSCPKGTVPIRRNTMSDVLRAKSLFDFGKKRRSIHLDRRTEKPDALGTNGHEVHWIIPSLLSSLGCTTIFLVDKRIILT